MPRSSSQMEKYVERNFTTAIHKEHVRLECLKVAMQTVQHGGSINAEDLVKRADTLAKWVFSEEAKN